MSIIPKHWPVYLSIKTLYAARIVSIVEGGPTPGSRFVYIRDPISNEVVRFIPSYANDAAYSIAEVGGYAVVTNRTQMRFFVRQRVFELNYLPVHQVMPGAHPLLKPPRRRVRKKRTPSKNLTMADRVKVISGKRQAALEKRRARDAEKRRAEANKRAVIVKRRVSKALSIVKKNKPRRDPVAMIKSILADKDRYAKQHGPERIQPESPGGRPSV